MLIKEMKKTNFILSIIALLILTLVSAHGDFDEAEDLIENRISCDQLTDEQLEVIGDYYMEQMHPGEAHEVMDEMMGGEGSESLKQMHINMARSFYCGEHEVMSTSMMNMMMGRNNMMGGKNMAYGVMGGGMFGTGLYGLIYLAIGAFIFSIIFWLTHNWLVKGKKR